LAGTVKVVSPGEANVSVTGAAAAAAAAGELTARAKDSPRSETYLIPITT